VKSDKMVWVEMRPMAVRIFRNYRAAHAASKHILHGDIELKSYGDAVKSIRHTLFLRSGGNCETCESPVLESGGHMHEQKHRGRGGEISLENSLFICAVCHARAHKERNPQWTK